MVRDCKHKAALGMIEAVTLVQLLRRQKSPGSLGIRAKRCRRCHGWYLTTKPRKIFSWA